MALTTQGLTTITGLSTIGAPEYASATFGTPYQISASTWKIDVTITDTGGSTVTQYGMVWNQGSTSVPQPADGTALTAGYTYGTSSNVGDYTGTVISSAAGMAEKTAYIGRIWLLNDAGYTYTSDEFTVTTGSLGGGGGGEV